MGCERWLPKAISLAMVMSGWKILPEYIWVSNISVRIFLIFHLPDDQPVSFYHYLFRNHFPHILPILPITCHFHVPAKVSIMAWLSNSVPRHLVGPQWALRRALKYLIFSREIQKTLHRLMSSRKSTVSTLDSATCLLIMSMLCEAGPLVAMIKSKGRIESKVEQEIWVAASSVHSGFVQSKMWNTRRVHTSHWYLCLLLKNQMEILFCQYMRTLFANIFQTFRK